jgi:hypothetical protein
MKPRLACCWAGLFFCPTGKDVTPGARVYRVIMDALAGVLRVLVQSG